MPALLALLLVLVVLIGFEDDAGDLELVLADPRLVRVVHDCAQLGRGAGEIALPGNDDAEAAAEEAGDRGDGMRYLQD